MGKIINITPIKFNDQFNLIDKNKYIHNKKIDQIDYIIEGFKMQKNGFHNLNKRLKDKIKILNSVENYKYDLFINENFDILKLKDGRIKYDYVWRFLDENWQFKDSIAKQNYKDLHFEKISLYYDDLEFLDENYNFDKLKNLVKDYIIDDYDCFEEIDTHLEFSVKDYEFFDLIENYFDIKLEDNCDYYLTKEDLYKFIFKLEYIDNLFKKYITDLKKLETSKTNYFCLHVEL